MTSPEGSFAAQLKQMAHKASARPLRQLATLVALICTILLMSACSGERSRFEPEVLPEERVNSALVRTPSPIYRDGKDLIIIKTIDGRRPTFHQDKAIVSPGMHIFQVALEFHHDDNTEKSKRYITKADVSLNIEIEADGEYLIDAVEDDTGVWLWALDLKTNIVVAGRRPTSAVSRGSVEPIWQKE